MTAPQNLAVPNRLPAETDAAWHAFQTYLLMPGRRTVAATARALGHAEQSTCNGWCAHHDWIERATAADQAVMARVQDKAVSFKSEHIDLARRLVRLAAKKLAKLEAREDVATDDESLSTGQLSALLDKAITLERLVNGESTDNHAHAHAVRVDIRGLAPEILRELKSRLPKAGG